MSIITMADGSQWLPSSSKNTVQCASCDNFVDTPEEVSTYPAGNCPSCNNPWTGAERRDTVIYVTLPQAMRGDS